MFDTPAALFDAAGAVARRIAQNPPLVVQGVKQVLNAASERAAADSLRTVALWNAAFLPSHDLREAMTAFVEEASASLRGALILVARWADWGAIAVASLAALALALTVLVARADLRDASEAMVRGEGETLLAGVRESIRPTNGPPAQAAVSAALEALRPSGLHFIAVLATEPPLAAGEGTIGYRGLGPGAIVIEGDRALLVGALPPRPLAPPPPPPDEGQGGARPPPPPSGGAPPLLVIEFHPAVLTRLQVGMNRTVVIGAAAVVVLLAFAAILTVRVVGRSRALRRAEQERRLMALGQMSSVMAHELRNPLASLKGNAQLLAEMLGPGSRELAKAELVVSEAQRLERLTQDLLAFVRDGALDRTDVAPSALLERALHGLPRERIDVDLAGAPATLSVDVSRLAVALGNLVRNALQETGEGARVHLRVSTKGRDVLLDVRDEGPGIKAGDEERIFEPFFTTRVHGTGLGLPVALRAVEQHGGTLRAQGHSEGGALFRVTLPDAASAG